MPEMATVCQDAGSTPPSMFVARGLQSSGPSHGYYNHCGYPGPSPHGQYSHDGYTSFQSSTHDQASPHLQHHVHGHQQQHPQQAWGYGMGVMGAGRAGVFADDWPQNYLVSGNSTPSHNPYNYQYRGTNSHGPLDYATQVGPDADPHGLDGSPSPSSSQGEATVTGIGPNNQGAKSLRPPYEWMKPSASLPQAGKTRTKDKYRVVYSDHQRLELEKEFHFSKYITIRRKAEIASQLGLSERQVKIWFQNRRAKERKQNKKRDEQINMHQNGGGNISSSSSQDHQQRLQHSSGHEPHSHTFIPKLEIDEEKSSIHDLACRSSALPQGVGLTSHPTPPSSIVLHPSLQSVAPTLMSRSVSHPGIARYHESVQVSAISPTPDDIAYRMSSNSDPTNSTMNLSGSSDSGVVSSH